MKTRRSFLRTAGGIAACAGFADVSFLASLPAVSAEDSHVASDAVRFDTAIEPLVRWLEDTPRERLLEEAGKRIQGGTSYRELLTALLLAGVRNIQPRPVGFKFHAVLVINSAHIASIASSDQDRWLPIFWALDYFKDSQAADRQQGDWTMGPVRESKVPPAHRAKEAFVEAMDNWDEEAADAAVVALARGFGRDELFDLFCRYGVRDFRDLGHKAIYVSNSFRTLEVIGWQHAEPVLRSLALALLDRGNDPNPARSDLAVDRPFRENLPRLARLGSAWLDGEKNTEATREILAGLRRASPAEASELVVQHVERGVAPASIFDGLFGASTEMLMRAPGIRSLHAVTFTNAVHYAWNRCADDSTRKTLLLQNAAFLPLYRGDPRDGGVEIDRFESAETNKEHVGIEEVFGTLGKDPLKAAQSLLGWLEVHPDPTPVAQAARRLIFLKGRNSHDYKFSSAVLEDYPTLAEPWRKRFLAGSVFNLRGSTEPDNQLVARTRAALS